MHTMTAQHGVPPQRMPLMEKSGSVESRMRSPASNKGELGLVAQLVPHVASSVMRSPRGLCTVTSMVPPTMVGVSHCHTL